MTAMSSICLLAYAATAGLLALRLWPLAAVGYARMPPINLALHPLLMCTAGMASENRAMRQILASLQGLLLPKWWSKEVRAAPLGTYKEAGVGSGSVLAG